METAHTNDTRVVWHSVVKFAGKFSNTRQLFDNHKCVLYAQFVEALQHQATKGMLTSSHFDLLNDFQNVLFTLRTTTSPKLLLTLGASYVFRSHSTAGEDSPWQRHDASLGQGIRREETFEGEAAWKKSVQLHSKYPRRNAVSHGNRGFCPRPCFWREPPVAGSLTTGPTRKDSSPGELCARSVQITKQSQESHETKLSSRFPKIRKKSCRNPIKTDQNGSKRQKLENQNKRFRDGTSNFCNFHTTSSNRFYLCYKWS